MNMTEEMLEILIGKYLDGEITAAEQSALQEAMDGNDKFRELFEQLQELHRRSEQAVGAELIARGREADDIFDMALRRRRGRFVKFTSPGWVRFAVGLAAGILLGIGVHLALSVSKLPDSSTAQPVAVIPPGGDAGIKQETPSEADKNEEGSNVVRNVDWYSFTDDTGNEWLIEGYRENVVRPAAYRDDL
jgi:hypothetical protein